ncbi:MAG TPA: cation:dicarboxylase symporter family transporter [Terriglobales bacterium]|nr:cation:dicarboxylase symporter family transporter [Terriglobales bacterium]
MKPRLLIAAVVLLAIAALLNVLDLLGWVRIGPILLTTSRWISLAALLAYAVVRRSLTTWIVFGMFVGAEVGHDFPRLATHLRVLAQIFLQLIKAIIAPLLFGTLVSGIAGHADLKKVGRMGVRAIIYFEVVTTLALFIGLAAINISKAGVGVHLPAASVAEAAPVPRPTSSELILHIFPENLAKSVAEGQVLQIVIFSILFGIALAMVREDKRRPMLAFTESLAEVMFKFTNLVMLFAPIGVGAAIAYTVGHTGMGVLLNLAKLLATLYVALIVFLIGVLLPIALLVGVPLGRFLRAVAEPASIAFGTSSSEAALPSAMEAMEGLGIPRPTVAFVIPTGYSFNLDGSSLYLSLAGIFVAQAAGVHMSVGQQLFFLLTLMLTSKGVAGVSRAAIVILLGTVGMFGLPVEPVFILLGIDQLMDMARTSVNVIGNCLATVVIARWEGDFAVSPTADPTVIAGPVC